MTMFILEDLTTYRFGFLTYKGILKGWPSDSNKKVWLIPLPEAFFIVGDKPVAGFLKVVSLL